MNWTDRIESDADVTIFSSGAQLIVDFARLPSSEVEADLLKLNEKAGFYVQKRRETEYLVFKPEAVTRANLSRAIRQMLEAHGNKVEDSRVHD